MNNVLLLLLLAASFVGAIVIMVVRQILRHKKQQPKQPTVQGAQLIAEEAQRATGQETQPPSEGKGRPPINRGGKPRSLTTDQKKHVPERGVRIPKPEIVCWKKERQWIPGVEVPEELLEKPGLSVLQNESSLLKDESEEAFWHLNQIGKVIVRWNEDEGVREVKIGQEGYLLFKLSGQSFNQGRLVKSPSSSGSYLVVAPEKWERDETLSGPPPVKPESVSLAGYSAHFFDLDKSSGQKIAFRLPDGRSLAIEAKAPRFELIGRRLKDANELVGPLFGEEPPRIRALDAQAWRNIRTVVVGEEGRGRGRWRMSFEPDPDLTEQALPSDVSARKGGWYFLRFYNSDDDLIESMDFRFLGALKEIRLRQPIPFPTGDGHKPVCVEFLHEADCTVQPTSNLLNIQIERQDDKTILNVLPDPACDESRWLVGPERGPQVEVTVNVERIWWNVEEEYKEPSEWRDRPIALSRDDFRAISNKAVWVRLPKRRWVDEVLVGFKRSTARAYGVRVTERTVAIPLRDFSDYEVGDQIQECGLRLWIERGHQKMEGALAILPAPQVLVAPKPACAVSGLTQSWTGVGRKKTAKAKAVMQNGAGEIKVNGMRLDDYFSRAPGKATQFLQRLRDLKEVSEVLSQMQVNITVEGSNPTTTRQAKAVAHAIARALMWYNHNLTPVLKQAGFGGVKVKV